MKCQLLQRARKSTRQLHCSSGNPGAIPKILEHVLLFLILPVVVRLPRHWLDLVKRTQSWLFPFLDVKFASPLFDCLGRPQSQTRPRLERVNRLSYRALVSSERKVDFVIDAADDRCYHPWLGWNRSLWVTFQQNQVFERPVVTGQWDWVSGHRHGRHGSCAV